MEQIGGKPAPAVGWALGIERVLELLKEQEKEAPLLVPDIYAVIPDDAELPRIMQALQQVRSHGLKVQMHAPASSAGGMGSMKSQFKKADASGAGYALVFGSDELLRNCVTVKALRDGGDEQSEKSLDSIVEWAAGLKSSR